MIESEGSEMYEKIVQLKLPSSDGKSYLTDVADTEQVFRLIQSILWTLLVRQKSCHLKRSTETARANMKLPDDSIVAELR